MASAPPKAIHAVFSLTRRWPPSKRGNMPRRITPSAAHQVNNWLSRVAPGSRLANLGSRQRSVNVFCPVHEDATSQTPSLSVFLDDSDQTHIECHGGCEIAEILDAWNLDWDEIRPATKKPAATAKPAEVARYDYTDAAGKTLYQKIKFEPKDFRVSPSGAAHLNPVLYRLPDVLRAVEAKGIVWLCEGESDADQLYTFLSATPGEAATTTHSSDFWDTSFSRVLAGTTVHVLADRDQPGYKYATERARHLQAAGCAVRVFRTDVDEPKADFVDHAKRHILQWRETLEDITDTLPQLLVDTLSEEFEKAVEKQTTRLLVNQEAQRRLVAEDRKPIPDIRSLTKLLTEPDELTHYLIDRLWPTEGHVLLSGQYKAGKTTVRNNVIQSLIDSSPLFGMFDVAESKDRRVGVLDFEMGDRENRRVMRQMGISNTDSVDLVDMRGAPSALNLLDAGCRREWTKVVRDNGWTVVILDPISPVISTIGIDEDNNTGIRKFLSYWQEMLYDTGVMESMVLHHSGHNGDRSRGAAAFRDWPSAYWDLNRDRDKFGNTLEDKPSYFRAKGRAVNVRESELSFDSEQLTIQEEGAGRAAKRSEQVNKERSDRFSKRYEECLEWLTSGPEKVTLRAWREFGTGTNAEKDEAYHACENQGHIARHTSKSSFPGQRG